MSRWDAAGAAAGEAAGRAVATARVAAMGRRYFIVCSGCK